MVFLPFHSFALRHIGVVIVLCCRLCTGCGSEGLTALPPAAVAAVSLNHRSRLTRALSISFMNAVEDGAPQDLLNARAEWLGSAQAKVKLMLDTARVRRARGRACVALACRLHAGAMHDAMHALLRPRRFHAPILTWWRFSLLLLLCLPGPGLPPQQEDRAL